MSDRLRPTKHHVGPPFEHFRSVTKLSAESSINVEQLVELGLIAGGDWLPETTSTNDLLIRGDFANKSAARDDNRAGNTDLYLLGTDRQTAGRGRNANQWKTTAGALTFSLLVAPPSASHHVEIDHISFRTALAVAEAIEQDLPVPALIKWPNDVFVQDRKIAGILIEQSPAVGMVIGVGLNVNNRSAASDADLRARMTSMADVAGQNVSQNAVLRRFLTRFADWRTATADHVTDAINRRDWLRGRTVAIVDGIHGVESQSGIAAGIRLDGALCLRSSESPSAMSAVYSGSVQVIERST